MIEKIRIEDVYYSFLTGGVIFERYRVIDVRPVEGGFTCRFLDEQRDKRLTITLPPSADEEINRAVQNIFT